jgi:hypothetical protein
MATNSTQGHKDALPLDSGRESEVNFLTCLILETSLTRTKSARSSKILIAAEPSIGNFSERRTADRYGRKDMEEL